MRYVVEQRTLECSPDAFAVSWNGVEVATFTYRDSAEYFVDRDVANRRQSVQPDMPSAHKVVDDKTIQDNKYPRCGGALESGQALFNLAMR